MPSFVRLFPSLESVVDTPQGVENEIILPELAPRNCRLEPYDPVSVPAFADAEEIIAYASPDSTYAVTRRLMDAARRTILIGIYDFSAPHMRELVLAALARGVRVRLMLDVDNRGERDLMDELRTLGVEAVTAPSCSNRNIRVFRSSHEKVIVIDGIWSLVQSGNYSDNSVPLNIIDGGDPENFRHGNRDTGLAVRSKSLARFFTKIIESDMDLELSAPEGAERLPSEEVIMIERAPRKLPAKLFASKRFRLRNALSIQPVLSPDNYMEVVPDLLRNATRSILIQQQYIRASQEKVSDLLEAVREAREARPGLDIRILLGKVFNASDILKEEANLDLLRDRYGLRLGRNIRFIDTDRFVHCHNKMVLVDGRGVLVSSQNWSKAAVSENREAGLYLENRSICRYFTEIFESDWSTGKRRLPEAAPEMLEPQDLRTGGFVRVSPADYQEV